MGLPQQAGLYDRVEAVLGSGHWIGLVCTGGGSQLIAWLLNHAGESRAVVEAQIPYHQAALAAWQCRPRPAAEINPRRLNSSKSPSRIWWRTCR